MERESEEQYLQAKIDEGKEKLERLKVHARSYSILLGRGSDYIEQAYLTYMEGSMVEDWEAFERWMWARANGKRARKPRAAGIARCVPTVVLNAVNCALRPPAGYYSFRR